MPGRVVCFVCGSQGADSVLRIRQHDREPYFPFLVHHDPPKGARIPTSDGIIDSCRLCFMFLTQQWDSYERSKTPLVKRLYWLKRADNGTFTGAEMRVQGEYIAQVMGLQYPPGYDDGSTPANPDREHAGQPKSSNMPSFSYGGSERGSVDNMAKVAAKESILDLSTPKKDSEKKTYNNHDKQRGRSSKDEVNHVCFICGQNDSFSVRNYLSVIHQGNNEPFFPVLQKLTPARGSEGISKSFCVKTCTPCRNILLQQWQAYEMTGTPLHARNYKLPSPTDYIREQSVSEHIKKEEIVISEKPKQMCCYICGGTYIVDHVRLLNTLPLKRTQYSPSSMFFPFVRELKRPSNAEPLRSDGSVIVCIKCYGHLSYQWEIQEMKEVPLYQRQYSLHFLSEGGESVTDYEKKQEPSSDSPKSEQIQPLNIQISATSPVQSVANSEAEYTTSQGLLAIASSADVESRSSSVSCSPVKCPDYLTDSRQDLGSNSKTVPHPLQKVCDIPKKICFLCGERCIIHKMKSLFSYPSRHEVKHSNQVDPFFPFLESVQPAFGADPVNEEGSVIVCKLCYYSLLKQWSEFEQSTNPGDSNRWLRKYLMLDHVCYICSIEGERKFMRTIAVDKFHFLKQHKAAKGALIIDDGQRVVVCKACAYSLMQQFAEFERMGLPPKLRKFNWMQRAGQVWRDDGEDDNQVCNKPFVQLLSK